MTVSKIDSNKVLEMRKSGASLREIGKVVGCTYENVRLILKHFPEFRTDSYLSQSEVARMLHTTHTRLKSLRDDSLKAKYGVVHYTDEDVRKVRLALERHCRICGVVVQPKRTKLCPECAVKIARNCYAFGTPERRRKMSLSARRWQKANPDKVRITQDRAAAKSKAKHYKDTTYIVFRRCSLPMGTVFQATGVVDRRLVLTDGTRVSLGCVRKVKEGLTT